MHSPRRAAFASRQRAAVSPNSELVDMVSSTEGFSQRLSITRLPCAAKLSTGDDTPPASRRAARMSQMLTAPLALPQATRLPQGDQEGAVRAEICAPTLRSSQLCADRRHAAGSASSQRRCTQMIAGITEAQH